ncbi:MAG: DNA/RNA nuclease SfsA, partial [Proteobacteria bacterium]|nr:DNA/RNA nuclease SfsA [Pseudomonadota bacterium]
MFDYPFNFEKVFATFLQRHNRFLISCLVEGKEVPAYLPNPGRLWELLIKDTPLILAKNKTELKIPYTVIACYKEGQPVLLHTHLTNKIVETLVDNNEIPFFKNYSVLSKETKYKKSRFDLLLKNEKEELFLEIKTCTLFGKKIAMFPDAVTERGTRHLLELKEISQHGKRACILFVIMNSQIDYFLPAYHIDLNFSKSLVEVRDFVDIKAMSVTWDKSFSYVDNVKLVNIPWNLIEQETNDRGCYLLLSELADNKKITAGNLKNINLLKGYYVYIGSALNSLSKRIARHKRKNKNFHWHIDYLTSISKTIKDIPIVTNEDLECYISEKISEIADKLI